MKAIINAAADSNSVRELRMIVLAAATHLHEANSKLAELEKERDAAVGDYYESTHQLIKLEDKTETAMPEELWKKCVKALDSCSFDPNECLDRYYYSKDLVEKALKEVIAWREKEGL